MRYYILDGQRYEVDRCAECSWKGGIYNHCQHPAVLNVVPALGCCIHGGIPDGCPLLEVEHDHPVSPKYSSPIFGREQREMLISSINTAHKKSGILQVPFTMASGETAKQLLARAEIVADYFGVTIDRSDSEYGNTSRVAWITFAIPADWTKESVAGENSIPVRCVF